ncbi:hypothetical protein WNZ14_22045 [Hoeflea sp. AS60]|uniref:hypothetical protein n=1 Tax=Hoeflea sp. AS60 TaxID=3135780 RepID=UPI00317F5720
MSVTSTARTAILATALVLVAGAGAQAANSVKDIENYGLSVAPGKIHSVYQVKDNDSLLYEIMIDGNDGAAHSVKVDDAGNVINHTSRLNISHGHDGAAVSHGGNAHK